jgi:hypothetical protein
MEPSSSSSTSSATPTFRGELYYLIAKFLEDGPCSEAAKILRREIEQNAIVPHRYDWTGDGRTRPPLFRGGGYAKHEFHGVAARHD